MHFQEKTLFSYRCWDKSDYPVQTVYSSELMASSVKIAPTTQTTERKTKETNIPCFLRSEPHCYVIPETIIKKMECRSCDNMMVTGENCIETEPRRSSPKHPVVFGPERFVLFFYFLKFHFSIINEH